MGTLLRWAGKFVGGAVVGLALGYVAAVLLAPDEGDDGRPKRLEGAEAFREVPRLLIDDMQARLQFAVEEGRQAAAAARAELETAAVTRNGHRPTGPAI
jgi:gas vesicle protein